MLVAFWVASSCHRAWLQFQGLPPQVWGCILIALSLFQVNVWFGKGPTRQFWTMRHKRQSSGWFVLLLKKKKKKRCGRGSHSIVLSLVLVLWRCALSFWGHHTTIKGKYELAQNTAEQQDGENLGPNEMTEPLNTTRTPLSQDTLLGKSADLLLLVYKSTLTDIAFISELSL